MSFVTCRVQYNSKDITFSNFKRSIESDLGIKSTKIQFKDDEGDYVTITCDLELSEALRLKGDNLDLKVYTDEKVLTDEEIHCPSVNEELVRLMNQKMEIKPQKRDVKKAIHFHVVCDSCNKNIIGIRYKCSNCENYDLCDECEAVNIDTAIHNSDHVFLKICRPVTRHITATMPNFYAPSENKSEHQIVPSSSSCPVMTRLANVERQLEEATKALKENDVRMNCQRSGESWTAYRNAYLQRWHEEKKVLKMKKKEEKMKLKLQLKELKKRANKAKKQEAYIEKLERKEKSIQEKQAKIELQKKELEQTKEEEKEQIKIQDKPFECEGETEHGMEIIRLMNGFENLLVQEKQEEKIDESFTNAFEKMITEQEQEQQQSASPDSSALSILSLMGFTDTPRNARLLFSYDGDLTRVIEELLRS